MSVLVRTWPALCALGAGLVHLAVASSSVPWLAVPLMIVGLAELSWAIVALVQQRNPVPRLALAVALAPAAAAGVFALVNAAAGHGGMQMSTHATVAGALAVVPLALASCLDLVVAFACGRALRAQSGRMLRKRADSVPGRPRQGTALAGILLGAVLVASVTVPALGATDAGRHASQHMQM